MKLRLRFLTLFFVSFFLRVSIQLASASVIGTIDLTGEYTVHSVPNSVPTVEQQLAMKNVSKSIRESVQNAENRKIITQNDDRIFDEKNQSTKIEQPSIANTKIEDNFLSEGNSTLAEANINRTRKFNNDGCNGHHNSAKNYSVSSAARLLISLLKIGPNRLYNQFRCDDPNDPYIPAKARDIYSKSVTWTPIKSLLSKKVTNDYIQCVTFVFMSYEMAGKPITKQGRTHAFDFLATKYTGKNGQFIKYKSGVSTELPREGDIIVWSSVASGTTYGHVGIVLEIRTDVTHSQFENKFGTILVASANASQVVYEYRYTVNTKTQVVTLSKLAHNWAKVPDYWLRMKD